MQRSARRFLDADRVSYERAVRNEQGIRSAYETPTTANAVDDRRLHRSTLWRWIGYLGGLSAALSLGLDLWQQHDPTSNLHRFEGAVVPRKYRSEQRGKTLRTTRRLLHLMDHWDRTYPERFFPRFATRPRIP